MNNMDRYTLVAYIATLATLVIVFLAALVTAAIQPGIIGRLEAFGLGTITGGLIGILRLPQRASSPATEDLAAAVKAQAETVAAANPTPTVTLNPVETAQAAPVVQPGEIQ